MNDIVDIDSEVKYVIYADDSTLIISGHDINNVIQKCNDVLSKLSTWAKTNRLKINPLKTKAIIFSARNKYPTLTRTLYLDSNEVEIVTEYKILGVYFSSHLSWDAHINYMSKKLSSITGVLSRCRFCFSQKLKIKIYHALFSSHLNYCSLVWSTTTHTNLNKLLVLQKRIIRQIGNMEPQASTSSSFRLFRIINVINIYKYRLLKLLFFSSVSVINLITGLASLQRRNITVNTRSRDIWVIPQFRTFYKYQALAHNIPYYLNKFPEIAGLNRKEFESFFIEL